MGNIEKITMSYKGIDYELAFNLNVMRDIQNEYGSMQAWTDKTSEGEEANIDALIFGLGHAINEGIEIYNEEHEGEADFTPRQILNEKQIGRLISNVGLSQTAEKIHKSMVEATKSDDPN